MMSAHAVGGVGRFWRIFKWDNISDSEVAVREMIWLLDDTVLNLARRSLGRVADSRSTV